MLDDLYSRSTEMFACHLQDWSDEEVGQLNTLLARLRDSFSCRGTGGCASGKHSGECRSRQADTHHDSYTRTPV